MVGNVINDMNVETITSPATVFESALYLFAKRYDVTATGVEICSKRIENGISSSKKICPIIIPTDKQTNTLRRLYPTAFFKSLDLRPATATPRVININVS